MSEQNGVTVRGPEARLYWGYFHVGTIRNWTATRAVAGVGALTGTVQDIDTTRMDTARDSQLPIVCVVQHQQGSWRWPLTALQIADTTLTASIVPPET